MTKHTFALGVYSRSVETRWMRWMSKSGNLSQVTIHVVSILCNTPCWATDLYYLAYSSQRPYEEVGALPGIEDRSDAQSLAQG